MAINYLEQKRLIFAKRQASRKDKGGNYHSMIKKVPAYIQTNGFLYTMVFLNEKDKDVFEDVYKWHCESDLNEQKLMPNISNQDFLNRLLEKEDTIIRAMTMETLALMKCFRRFVKQED